MARAKPAPYHLKRSGSAEGAAPLPAQRCWLAGKDDFCEALSSFISSLDKFSRKFYDSQWTTVLCADGKDSKRMGGSVGRGHDIRGETTWFSNVKSLIVSLDRTRLCSSRVVMWQWKRHPPESAFPREGPLKG